MNQWLDTGVEKGKRVVKSYQGSQFRYFVHVAAIDQVLRYRRRNRKSITWGLQYKTVRGTKETMNT